MADIDTAALLACKEKIAFEGPKTPDRGYTCRAWWMIGQHAQDALVEILKDGEVVRSFLFPAYKVFNIQAHFSDIVDSEIAENDLGYRQAAWNGIGPI